MRQLKLILFSLAMFATHFVHAQNGEKTRVAYLRYQAGVDGDCSASVGARADEGNAPPSQVLTVTCQGKQVLHYVTQDTFVDLFLNYPHADRVFAIWEGGSHVRFTAAKVDSHHLSASVVFDEQLEGAPEVINAPDVLLVQRGKRWLNGQVTSTPTSTDVYQWTGDKYELSKRWKWNDGMRYEDRFCVLDVKTLSCPVTPLPLK